MYLLASSHNGRDSAAVGGLLFGKQRVTVDHMLHMVCNVPHLPLPFGDAIICLRFLVSILKHRSYAPKFILNGGDFMWQTR